MVEIRGNEGKKEKKIKEEIFHLNGNEVLNRMYPKLIL